MSKISTALSIGMVSLLLLLSGCGSTPAPEATASDESLSQEATAASVSSEATGGESASTRKQLLGQREMEKVNQQIALAAFDPSPSFTPDRINYQIGAGDVLDISVFQVDELNRSVRVSGDGYIALPLLGQVNINGFTTTEVESLLAERLGAEFLHDPQVTVFISEFRSHQVAVLGAVASPNVYSIERPKTVIEMLSLAGGLSADAGAQVHVQRMSPGNLTRKETTVIGIKDLLSGTGDELDFVLHNGDSVLIPKAGTVFVEGAVERPGGYSMKGETNVLKLLAMAQGVKGYANKGHIQIYRQLPEGGDQIYEVSLKVIRDDQSKDLILQDGDLVIVRDNPIKKGAAGFWREFTRLFSFGTL